MKKTPAGDAFRVLALTDTHLFPEDYEEGFECISKLTSAAEPDFVLFNGDNFFGKKGEDLDFYSRLDDYFIGKASNGRQISGTTTANTTLRRERGWQCIFTPSPARFLS